MIRCAALGGIDGRAKFGNKVRAPSAPNRVQASTASVTAGALPAAAPVFADRCGPAAHLGRLIGALEHHQLADPSCALLSPPSEISHYVGQ